MVGVPLCLQRMAQAVEVECARPLASDDIADDVRAGGREPYDADLATDADVVVYRISGAFSSAPPRP
jgi:SulP family sulfate permease